jgi:hypothetical protein
VTWTVPFGAITTAGVGEGSEFASALARATEPMWQRSTPRKRYWLTPVILHGLVCGAIIFKKRCERSQRDNTNREWTRRKRLRSADYTDYADFGLRELRTIGQKTLHLSGGRLDVPGGILTSKRNLRNLRILTSSFFFTFRPPFSFAINRVVPGIGCGTVVCR